MGKPAERAQPEAVEQCDRLKVAKLLEEEVYQGSQGS